MKRGLKMGEREPRRIIMYDKLNTENETKNNMRKVEKRNKRRKY